MIWNSDNSAYNYIKSKQVCQKIQIKLKQYLIILKWSFWTGSFLINEMNK